MYAYIAASVMRPKLPRSRQEFRNVVCYVNFRCKVCIWYFVVVLLIEALWDFLSPCCPCEHVSSRNLGWFDQRFSFVHAYDDRDCSSSALTTWDSGEIMHDRIVTVALHSSAKPEVLFAFCRYVYVNCIARQTRRFMNDLFISFLVDRCVIHEICTSFPVLARVGGEKPSHLLLSVFMTEVPKSGQTLNRPLVMLSLLVSATCRCSLLFHKTANFLGFYPWVPALQRKPWECSDAVVWVPGIWYEKP